MEIGLDRDKVFRLCDGLGKDLADHLAVLKPEFYLLLSKYPAPAVPIQDLAIVVAGGVFLGLAAEACLTTWGYVKPSVVSGSGVLADSLHLEEAGELTFLTYGWGDGPRRAFPDLLNRQGNQSKEHDLVEQVIRQRIVGLMTDSGDILRHVFKGCTSLGQLREEFSHIPDLDSLLSLLIRCNYLVLEGDQLLVVAAFLDEGQSGLVNSALGLLLPEFFSWHQHNLSLIRTSTRVWGEDSSAIYGYFWPLLAEYCCQHLSRVGFFANPAQDLRGFRPAIIATPLLMGMLINVKERAELIFRASL